MSDIDYEKKSDELLDILEAENAWKKRLKRGEKGKVENCIENYLLYFNESKKYKGKLKYNEFLQQKEFDNRVWDDFDEAQAVIDIEIDTGLTSADKAKRAIDGVFNNHRYNPVQDYLNDLTWNNQKNIETIFIKCFNVEDTPLVRALSKKWFIAAVKRVFEPGCQFDNMIVLQGPTGIGKTTFCRLISKNFYSELKFDEIGNKDIVDKLNKSWVAIIDEMDNFGKKEMASIKSFLSVKQDVVRLAYAHNTKVYYRHCIFIGSLNDDTFLRDITTSVERRFWIFKCNREGMDTFVSDILTDDVVDQLWAEAMHYYKENPNIYLDVETEMQKQFAEDQRQYKTFNDDIFIDYIKDILDKPYLLVNGEFNDNNDFLRQYSDETILEGNKTYINKIPMSSVLYVLKEKYRDVRNPKFVAAALSDEWEYKNIWYRGKSWKGLIRKNQINEVIKHEDNLLPI